MRQFRPAFVFLLLLTLLFGGAYPLVATLFAQAVFPQQAHGSLLRAHDGQLLGSALIGQNFSQPRYFWGRLSATAPVPYNAAASSGSNYGTNNPALLKAAKDRALALQGTNIPVDLLTASGSGLDPHISPQAAEYQIPRVAQARGLSQEAVREKVEQATKGRQFGVLGEPTVNVLQLNLALDGEL